MPLPQLTLACWLLSGSAHAAPADEPEAAPASTGWSTRFTNDLELRYWVIPDRLPDPPDVAVFNYVEQVERLVAAASKGDWSLSVQVDQVALLANRYYLDDVKYTERALVTPGTPNLFGEGADVYANIEKLQVRRETRSLTLQLGDSYAAFGRGVALNLNRNVDIDIDTSIQGVKVVHRSAEWDLTGVIGQLNRQQVFQDNPNRDLKGDYRHAVMGLRAERYGLGPMNLGAHLVIYDFATQTGLAEGIREIDGPDAVVRGVNAELNGVLGLDTYVEFDHFQYLGDALPDAPPQGWALYGSSTGYIGSNVLQVEFKRYKDIEQVNALLAPELYEVAIAPTLEYERSVTEDSAATLNSNDITGGRARFDLAAIPGQLTPWASVAVFRDLTLGGLHFNDVPETIVHPLLGVEWIKDDAAILATAGLRTDLRDGGQEGADRQLHADASILAPLGKELHANISLYGERFMWGQNPFQQADYTEIETSWSVSRGSWLTFTWYTDYSSNPLVGTRGNLLTKQSFPLYAAGEIQVKPSGALTIKAFYGAYKAGIRCSGGQCRLLPGFDGARLSVVGTF